MLIIPAISIRSAESVILILAEKNYNPKELLSDVYYSDSGFFFVALIIQQGCLSSSFYMIRAADLIMNWLSPWIADYKRKFMNDQFAWRRRPENSFQYGYFYAQMVVVFAIVLIFSSTAPIITIAGALFYLLRHVTDSFNIMTFHRIEMESRS